MKLFLAILLAAMAASADTNFVLCVPTHDLLGVPYANRSVVITSTDPLSKAYRGLVYGDAIPRRTDSNGNAWFTNPIPGNYRLDLAGTPTRSFTLYVRSNLVGTVDVRTLLTSGNTNIVAAVYSTVAVDAALSTKVDATNGSATNLAVFGALTINGTNLPTDFNASALNTKIDATNGSATNLAVAGELTLDGNPIITNAQQNVTLGQDSSSSFVSLYGNVVVTPPTGSEISLIGDTQIAGDVYDGTDSLLIGSRVYYGFINLSDNYIHSGILSEKHGGTGTTNGISATQAATDLVLQQQVATKLSTNGDGSGLTNITASQVGADTNGSAASAVAGLSNALGTAAFTSSDAYDTAGAAESAAGYRVNILRGHAYKLTATNITILSLPTDTNIVVVTNNTDDSSLVGTYYYAGGSYGPAWVMTNSDGAVCTFTNQLGNPIIRWLKNGSKVSSASGWDTFPAVFEGCYGSSPAITASGDVVISNGSLTVCSNVTLTGELKVGVNPPVTNNQQSVSFGEITLANLTTDSIVSKGTVAVQSNSVVYTVVDTSRDGQFRNVTAAGFTGNGSGLTNINANSNGLATSNELTTLSNLTLVSSNALVGEITAASNASFSYTTAATQAVTSATATLLATNNAGAPTYGFARPDFTNTSKWTHIGTNASYVSWISNSTSAHGDFAEVCFITNCGTADRMEAWLHAIPTTPYYLTAAVSCDGTNGPYYGRFGICLYQSSTASNVCVVASADSSSPGIGFLKYNSLSSYNGAYGAGYYWDFLNNGRFKKILLELDDDGTNLSAFCSFNEGVTWQFIGSAGRTAFLPSADKVGIIANANSARPGIFSIYHWCETNCWPNKVIIPNP